MTAGIANLSIISKWFYRQIVGCKTAKSVVLSIVVVALLPSTAVACDQLRITDAWISAPIPGPRVSAMYGTLRNTGDSSITINRVNSDAYQHAMLHETVTTDGRVRMKHVHKLVIAPGASLSFEPGGRHVMLERPQLPIKAGDSVAVGFRCGKSTTTVEVEVRDRRQTRVDPIDSGKIVDSAGRRGGPRR